MTAENNQKGHLEASVHKFMHENWNGNYTAPNPTTYPFLWLWDSCFHSLIWAALGEEEKCLTELSSIFESQAEDGFIPHVNYSAQPNLPQSEWANLWGRTHSSSITQPPMYGHAIAELTKMGIEIPEEIIEKAKKGLAFLFNQRRRDFKTGLIYLCHPWETGIDNSPRWDDYIEGDFQGDTEGNFQVKAWDVQKIELLKHIELNENNSPEFNPAFPVVSIGFNALVAFNVLELEKVAECELGAIEIIQALDESFDSELKTWVDPSLDKSLTKGISSRVRVLDALLTGFVSDKNFDIIEEQVNNKKAFGGEFGLATVHREESSFSQNTYWRGSVWPQMMYLFIKMFEFNGREETATILKESFLNGVLKANFSEYWGADTGEGLGACPQSWAGLIVMNQLP